MTIHRDTELKRKSTVCREADTGSNKRGPASAKRGRPSSLPVGDEEEEGE